MVNHTRALSCVHMTWPAALGLAADMAGVQGLVIDRSSHRVTHVRTGICGEWPHRPH
jgi:hypothetical protein